VFPTLLILISDIGTAYDDMFKDTNHVLAPLLPDKIKLYTTAKLSAQCNIVSVAAAAVLQQYTVIVFNSTTCIVE